MVRASIYVTLLGLAILGASPNVLTYAYIAFFLPGVALAIAPTLLLYLPFADVLFTGLRRRLPHLVFAGLTGLAVLAFGPALAGQLALYGAIGPIEQGPGKTFGQPPPRLLIHTTERIGRARLFPDRPGLAGSTCDDLCARLLLDGRVQEVVRPYNPPRDAVSLAEGYRGQARVYALATSNCASAGPGSPVTASQETLRALGAARRCIGVRKVEAAAFDAALTVESSNQSVAPFMPVSFVPKRLTRWAAWACNETGCHEVASAVYGTGLRLAAPFHIVAPKFLSSARREWARTPVDVDTVADFPWASLGLTSGGPPMDATSRNGSDIAEPSAGAVREAALKALSDSVAEGRGLDDRDRAVIEPAMKEVAQRSGRLDAEETALMRAFLQHPSPYSPWGIDLVFRNRSDAVEVLKDDLISAYINLAEAEAERQKPLTTSFLRGAAGDGQLRFRQAVADAIDELPTPQLRGRSGELLDAMRKPGMEKDAPRLRARLQTITP